MTRTIPWRRRPVPAGLDPAVERLFVEMNAQQCGDRDMAARAGIDRHTLSAWRRETKPNIINLRAALNVLGLDLAVVTRRD